MTHIKLFPATITLLLVLTGCSGSDPTNVAGTWTGDVFGGPISPTTFVLQQVGTSLEGEVTFNFELTPEVHTVSGEVNGQTVSFTSTDGPADEEYAFEAFVVGNRMKGTVAFTDAGGTAGGGFSVTRQ